jgi:hypothetical protein
MATGLAAQNRTLPFGTQAAEREKSDGTTGAHVIGRLAPVDEHAHARGVTLCRLDQRS